ncbi:MAG: murein biosynthesis integral membrane protein MurJ [Omnitrophica WOR_2 bacterium RIFCSPHIGHO2_02_FULL_67_20]|nr:MAG: murein biosynthesis integral membrane protein MurJ [Omnitrophica WOR_2 bacterium RIFCSPHIGHO2_02_FULL_67_20]
MSASALHRIARSTGVLTLTTGASRLLGFVRDVLLAGLFGTGIQAQAFVIAFRIPNLLRDLVAEGAVTSAFVPVLTWYRTKEPPEEFWRLSQALLVRLAVFVLLLGLAGALAAEPIVRLIAPGFARDPEKLALTVRLTRILFPFITLVGLWAYFMGLLNSLHHFAMPSLGPAILNVAMIMACVWVVPRVEPGVLALAVAVIAGGIVQLAIQLPPAVRLGFRFRWRWRHPGSERIMRLLGPRMMGSAVYQASVLIDTALASLAMVVGEGAVAALYFANRLVQLPMALFGTASAQASLPSLAEQAAHQDWEAFSATLLSVLRMVGFVIVPAAAGLIALAFPIVSTLFEHGAFDHRSTIMTAQALGCYALGLLAYSASKVLTGAFYALQDTRTPVRLAAEALAVNVLLSLALMWPLRLNGLALAAAMSNTLNAVRLTLRLEHRLNRPLLAPLREPLLPIAAASLLMGLGCWGAHRALGEALPSWLALLLVIALGALLYALACRLLRVRELATVIRWLGNPPLLQPFAGE